MDDTLFEPGYRCSRLSRSGVTDVEVACRAGSPAMRRRGAHGWSTVDTLHDRMTGASVSAGPGRCDSKQRLLAHRDTWGRKPVLREVYAELHRAIDARLSRVPGPTIEAGGGPGGFKAFRPATCSFDLVPCSWLDFAADACRPPLAPHSVANVVMIDVLHHLAYVQQFFDAMADVLKPGGRIVMVEPYVSPLSWWIYRFLHPERCAMSVHPLRTGRDVPASDPDRAWEGNQAIPTVLFWRDLREFERRFPALRVVERQRMGLLAYPLSGGFEYPQLLPRSFVPAVRRLERIMTPLARWAAFRCLIVIQRR